MFHRKIVMGGNTFCYWSSTTKEKCAEYCRQKALKLGWKAKDVYKTHEEESKDLLEFMRTVPAHKLAMHMIGNRVFFDEGRLPLTPVIDGEILPKSIPELRADAPSMESICGVGEQESLLFCKIFEHLCNGTQLNRSVIAYWTKSVCCSGALGVIRGTGKDMDKVVHELARNTELNVSKVENVIGNLYGDLKELRKNSKAMQEAYVKCTSDVFSNYGCYRYLENSQQHDKPTYAYYFTHTSRNMWGWLATVVPFLAGTHSSDIIYLFDCNYFTAPLSMNKVDRKISEMTSAAFMEFVKTGNPNKPEAPFNWETVSKTGEMRMLNFCEKPSMIGRIFDNRMQRLQDLLKELLPRKH
ncbi:hypothetical protein NECAME_12802 [Necator americanus]|uniref:Carboxylesterase type B domain-containing protein n=1 Tax=Necator americanus TaxID=51031 RepID=W2T137_NECAM|nr:hypothetical protein NECAME_12802 [Necator americanus]ETN74692.1 hypothetical protein NECAME_12802 [Necator americanus]